MEYLAERRRYYYAQLEQYRRYMKTMQSYTSEFVFKQGSSLNLQTSFEEEQVDVENVYNQADKTLYRPIDYLFVDYTSYKLNYIIALDDKAFQQDKYRLPASQTAIDGYSNVHNEQCDAYCERNQQDTAHLTLSSCQDPKLESKAPGSSLARYKQMLDETREQLNYQTSVVLAEYPASYLVASIRQQISSIDTYLSRELAKSGYGSKSHRDSDNYQKDIEQTVRQLSRLERDNKLQLLKQQYGYLSYMVQRQERIIENDARSIEEFRALSLYLQEKANEYRYRIEYPPITFYELAIQTNEVCDKEVQCSGKRSRKPRLTDQLFMARLSTFEDNYLNLSQTSKDYLKWRRGE